MIRVACSLLLVFLPLPALTAENPTALKALKVIPKEEVKKLARIEAQGGTPTPERWHFLVHHPESEAGLKEYVVASGELVADRDISQFAENLAEGDVIGDEALKVDSDKLADLAKKYAAANKAPVATLNYQLLREGEEAQPIWRIKCLDEAGNLSGTLVVTAAKGVVVSHEGFPVEPKEAVPGKKKKSALRLETESAEMVAVATDFEAESDEFEEEETGAVGFSESPEVPHTPAKAVHRTSPRKKIVSNSGRSSSRRQAHRRVVKVPHPVAVARRVTSPVRNIVRRVLPF